MSTVPLVRPARLRGGDRVVIVAPSGPIPRERLDAGVDILRAWDLDVEVGEHVLDTHSSGYLAGGDADRARDLQRAWLDPGVAAVICARGGYGAQRMVDLLDWDAMRAAGPKVFVGFSDVTALHEAFAVRLGLATLHGPMAAGVAFVKDGPTQEHLRRTLFEPENARVLTSPAAAPLVPGTAHGVTAGGCLSLIAAEAGTPHARRSLRGAIWVIEDVAEEAYRLDRCLTQLLRSGLLDGVAAVALGSWQDCSPEDEVRRLMLDRLGPLGVPVLWELGFGHCPSHITVPLGVPALLDAGNGTLTLDVPALL
ncbi:S66 peptidase family protein [Wenjunlia tyrosinilytica]|uniref:Carboxypeptidase n=1 Tax=Wenjunlia tyrosinilytica TaxID=1544741 RepID=A0A917ZUS7_9ACTN|nr:LD-carboxypeptidase [Wenjunlia tyrosinilytica]GGO95016.1 putative carboxypeptidase [Wenjunlia tyrosinilytica]